MNVDYANMLANDYGIEYLPTLVLFNDGVELSRSVGLVDKNTIVDLLNSSNI